MVQTIERTKDKVDNMIDRARDAVVGVSERAERGIEAAAERTTERAHEAGTALRSGAETLSRDAHQRVELAANACDRGMARVRGGASRAWNATSEQVAANPGKSLLIAAAAGLGLGLLLPRRQRTFPVAIGP